MIRYESFTTRYGALLAVDARELEVRRGETVALVGPNGSGKTTTLKALVGLVRPTSGRVLAGGFDATLEGPAARSRLGYLPQRLSFPDGATARETMRIFARLRDVDRREAEALLERVGLDAAAGRAVDEFSGGMRQRLGLAIALLGRPLALVLDEPSAALDPTGALLVRDLIREIAAGGTTVLLSSHDRAEVAALADRIAIFVDGRLRAEGSLGHLERESGRRGVEAVYRVVAA